jgi:hypothetical protein
MKETQYPGYYITEDGRAYRKPTKRDSSKKIDENGLIYLKPSLRGNPRDKKYQYECINISLYDENGKFVKQIKKSIHQLVAETFIPNPNNYSEIDHIDRNKKNNHINNLQWCNRLNNMRWSSEENAKYFKLTDIITNKIYEGENLQKFIRENWEWISKRTKISNSRKFTVHLIRKYKKQAIVNGFILKR